MAADWSSGLPTSSSDVVNNAGGTITFSDLTASINSFLSSTGNFTLSGGTLNVTGNFTNSGSGALNFYGGTLNVGGNFQSSGAVILSGGIVSGSGAATSTFEVANTLTLNGGTLSNFTINPGVGQGNTLNMQGGTLQNDVLNQSLNISSTPVYFSTLDTVTVNGDLSVANGGYDTYVPNSLTITGKTSIVNNANFVFSNATASNTSGMNEIVLGDATSGTQGTIYQYGGNTLTLTSNTLVHGYYGYIGQLYNGSSDTLLNQGTINADVNGGSLYIRDTTFTNTGTLEATNGGTLNVQSQTTSLAAGNITVGAGSTVAVNNSVTRTSGTTTIDGGFTVPSGQSVLLQGGLLTGTGTLNGNLVNSGGTIRPGDLLGALNINGNFSQSAGAITEIDLGGTTPGAYGQLNVTNLAQLGGELNIKVEPGFQPTVGETFDFLTYGSLSGSFDTVFALDPGFSYNVTYSNGTGVGVLTVATVAGVPETSTIVTAGLMLGAGGFLLRRTRQQRNLEEKPKVA